MRALTAQLTMMIEIRRHLSGFAKRKRWANAAETRSGIQRLVWGWDEVVNSIRWKNDEARTAATALSRPREFWLDDIPSKEVVSQEINILLSKMHGRKRTEERMKISQAVRDRELRRKANKIGSVIQSVVGKKRVNFDMSWLRVSPTEITTAPMEILQLLNGEFFKWHAGTIDALTGINARRPDWELILDSRNQFDLIMSDAKVPQKELEIIWNALQSTKEQLDETTESGDTLREKIKKLLVMPTIEEWRHACKNASGGKASSMSGLTYSIVKGWPDEVVDRTYECIAGIKAAGEHPKHWTYKWLAPMPKKSGDDITVNDLRPLTLIVDKYNGQENMARHREAQPPAPCTTWIQEETWHRLPIVTVDRCIRGM
jgi:hypothetical protein